MPAAVRLPGSPRRNGIDAETTVSGRRSGAAVHHSDGAGSEGLRGGRGVHHAARPSSAWRTTPTPSSSPISISTSAPAWTCWTPPSARTRSCSVILMTGRGTVETVMAATRGGAFDYIAKPFELDVMFDADRARRGAAQRTTKTKPRKRNCRRREMIGSSRRPWWRSTRRLRKPPPPTPR